MEFLILNVNYPIELPIDFEVCCKIQALCSFVLGIIFFFFQRIRVYKDGGTIQLPNFLNRMTVRSLLVLSLHHLYS